MRKKNNSSEKELDLVIGTRLKALRIAKGLSQTELGHHAGISFQQIQKCERGQNRVGAGRLWQFCQILGASPNQFFDEIEKLQNNQRRPSSTQQEWSTMLSRQNFKLVKNFMRIKDYNLKVSILRICEKLASESNNKN
ncbi:MAG: helix-turn-helix transcriptional regulator [Hyphomonadaceae bacterium]|nr:helix-turn-helix transcriptional regulator [Hyphomonadaceae bacterium]